MRISIRPLLVGGFIGLQVIPVTIILASSYLTSQRVLLQHAKDIMENIATFSILEAQNYLKPAEDAAQLTQRLADSQVVSSQDDTLLEQYFYEQLEQHPNFAGIYLGRPNGEFVYVSRMDTHAPGGFRTKLVTRDGETRRTELVWKDHSQRVLAREMDPDDKYDPRSRPWYKKALEVGETVWTEPYIFFTSRKPGLTSASPAARDEGEFIGVVGVDIEIDELSTFLASLKVGKNGRAFIVNQNGDVVAFPDSAMIKRVTAEGDSWRLTNITELEDPLSRKAFTSLALQPGSFAVDRPVFGSFEHANQTYHTMFAPFSDPQWPWVIGIYLPEDDYLGPIKSNRSFNIAVMICVAALASLTGLTIARSVVRPMTAFRTEAAAVRDGDLETTSDKHTIIREIQETAASFAEMKTGLSRSRHRNAVLTHGLEQSAEELRRKEMRLRNTFTALLNFSDALIICDASGAIRFANPAAEHLLGTEPDHLLGQPCSLQPDPDGVLQLRGETAEPCLVEVRKVDTEWEGQPATLIALRDITERRRMEEEIRWRADTLEALHEVALELATREKLPELWQTLAEHASRILGAKGAAVFYRGEDGSPPVEALRYRLGPPIAPASLAETQGAVGKVFRTGEPWIVNDYAAWESRWTGHRVADFNACIAAPIRWGGKILGVLLVGDDSPRVFHPADVALLERFTPLAAAAIEQQRLLSDAEDHYHRAQQDAETKTVLLQEVNHRVKNNLSAIIGLLYAEQRHTSARGNPQYREALRDLVGRVQSMAAVHELLTASEWSPLLLSDLVRNIAESAVRSLPAPIRVRVEVEHSSILVAPSLANSIAMVIHELAMNSVKHAFLGADCGAIEVTFARSEENWVTLAFKDNGPGYPSDVLTSHGHNLGLHLVQTLVSRDLGGRVDLASAQGAATSIHFPLVQPSEEPSHA